jgi:hypothetical protein
VSSVTAGLVLGGVFIALGLVASVLIIWRGQQRLGEMPEDARRPYIRRLSIWVAVVAEAVLVLASVAPFFTQGEFLIAFVDGKLIGVVALLPAVSIGLMTLFLLSRKYKVALIKRTT